MKRSNQNKILISVDVHGSPGPIRLLVNEDTAVATVISKILKAYAREQRLPFIGTQAENFDLFCRPAYDYEALSPKMTIGACRARSFLLCKKPRVLKNDADEEGKGEVVCGGVVKGRIMARVWRSWIEKSFKVAVSAQ